MTEDHISCREVVELVSDYIEHALPPHDISLFEEHLNCCDGCANYVDQLRTAVAATEMLAPTEVPDEVRETLMATFRNWRGA